MRDTIEVLKAASVRVSSSYVYGYSEYQEYCDAQDKLNHAIDYLVAYTYAVPVLAD